MDCMIYTDILDCMIYTDILAGIAVGRKLATSCFYRAKIGIFAASTAISDCKADMTVHNRKSIYSPQ